jgi:hypothetical protein
MVRGLLRTIYGVNKNGFYLSSARGTRYADNGHGHRDAHPGILEALHAGFHGPYVATEHVYYRVGLSRSLRRVCREHGHWYSDARPHFRAVDDLG